MLNYQEQSELPIPETISSHTVHTMSLQRVSLDDRKTSSTCKSMNSANSDINADALNNRVMLIDGTSIMYRSYYKLLGTKTNLPAVF